MKTARAVALSTSSAVIACLGFNISLSFPPDRTISTQLFLIVKRSVGRLRQKIKDQHISADQLS